MSPITTSFSLLAPLLLLAPLGGTGPHCRPPSPKGQPNPLARQVIEPSVIINAGHAWGSGTVLTDRCGKKVILTAEHVIHGHKTVTVISRYRKDLWLHREATVLHSCSERDLALLEVDDEYGLTAGYLAGREEELFPGEEAWYCGFGSGLSYNLQKTIINQDSRKWTTCNGGGWYGHSGSGLFVLRDGRYRLVGVMVQLQNPENPKSPLFCVTRATIHQFLSECPVADLPVPMMPKVPH